jgi:hypothetical protein
MVSPSARRWSVLADHRPSRRLQGLVTGRRVIQLIAAASRVKRVPTSTGERHMVTPKNNAIGMRGFMVRRCSLETPGFDKGAVLRLSGAGAGKRTGHRWQTVPRRGRRLGPRRTGAGGRLQLSRSGLTLWPATTAGTTAERTRTLARPRQAAAGRQHDGRRVAINTSDDLTGPRRRRASSTENQVPRFQRITLPDQQQGHRKPRTQLPGAKSLRVKTPPP